MKIGIVILDKGGDHYIFMVDETARNRKRLERTLKRFAGCAELGFTWYDAATVAKRARQVFVNDRKG